MLRVDQMREMLTVSQEMAGQGVSQIRLEL